MPECIWQPIHEVQQQVQAPIELAYASALSVVSMACQDLIDVKTPAGMISPVSLYMMSIADSGERKSSTDKQFMQPLQRFEQQLQDQQIQAKNSYSAKHEIWKLKHKNLRAQIKKRISQGAAIQELEEQLSRLNAQEPMLPQEAKMLYADTTPEALLYGLHVKGRSAGLISSEGDIVLKSGMAHQLPQLNQLWDGDSLSVERKMSESFILDNARLSLAIMIQSEPFTKFISTKKEVARHSGFLARVLLNYPQSTQGSRQLHATPLQQGEYLKQFQQRVLELLQQTQQAKERTVLEFLPNAAKIWLDFYNTVESQLGLNGYYEDIKDAASKAANNAARLAALLHYFDKGTDKIDVSCTTVACQLSLWHLNEFKRLLGEKSPLEIQQEYAELLYQWLLKNYHKSGNMSYSKRHLLQYGPSKLRNKEALSLAILQLSLEGKIWNHTNSKPAGITLIIHRYPLMTYQPYAFTNNVHIPYGSNGSKLI